MSEKSLNDPWQISCQLNVIRRLNSFAMLTININECNQNKICHYLL